MCAQWKEGLVTFEGILACIDSACSDFRWANQNVRMRKIMWRNFRIWAQFIWKSGFFRTRNRYAYIHQSRTYVWDTCKRLLCACVLRFSAKHLRKSTRQRNESEEICHPHKCSAGQCHCTSSEKTYYSKLIYKCTCIQVNSAVFGLYVIRGGSMRIVFQAFTFHQHNFWNL